MAPATRKPLPDVLGPDLDVLFCGINPGLVSAARGHHFARPGNRFWPALHLSGFTPRLLAPEEDGEVPRYGIGLTNLVDRASAGADALTAEELRAGAAALEALAARVRPRVVAVLGMGAYRTGFGRPGATVGLPPEPIGPAAGWLLPNPSGRTAHYQLPDLVRLLGELREYAASRDRR